MARITINGISIDPVAQSRGLAAAALEAPDATNSNYILIQCDHPLTPAERAQLADIGVVIQEYVPENTYLCGYEPTDLSRIQELPFVTWAGVYFQGFKIPPSLREPRATADLVPEAATRARSRRPHTVDVVLHADVEASSEPVREQIAAAALVAPEDLEVGRRKVRVTVQESSLEDLAQLDDVRHIEEVPGRQLFNSVARGILDATVNVGGVSYLGDGEVIAVADTGFDKGSTTDTHPAFTGRVAKLYALGRTGPDRADDPHGHGTHVAGSVLGDGTSTTMDPQIQGTAPRAALVLQSTLDASGGLGGIPADLHDLFEPPYKNDGARVHTNSWGATTPALRYDASATEIDDVVWQQPDLVICFAAGNDGTDGDGNGVVDAGSIGSQSAAKNCITVGATESLRDFEPTYGDYWPSDFPTNPVHDDRQADNCDGLAAFSSRGPTQEQRIKPDVVAPGTCILSTLSRNVAVPSSDFGISKDPLYFFDTGTSMATPLVAGCAAVLRETLIKNGTPTPSAALIKAMLINGAVEVTGQYAPSEAGASPNNNSGFGRVDLAGSVIVAGQNPDAGFGDGGPLDEGESTTIEIDIPESPRGDQPDDALRAAGPQTFKITLCWTDPAGAALQNDLDLIVRAANGEERHGNMGILDGFDRQNNVEQVLWTGIPAGPATVIIRAFRITAFPQAYAYAWRLG